MKKKSFNTELLHTEYSKPDVYNSLSFPVYNSAAFEFESAEQMELAFTGRINEHTYSRITNPTVQYFEDRVKAITGAFSVTALNSGMAAITNTIITVAKAGCNIVTSRHLFGNTYSLFTSTLADFGIEARFCDLTDLKQVENSIDEKTAAVFLEIITNPQMEVADLKRISEICTSQKVPLIADTTIIPFGIFKAKEFGVDIEVVSSTKYISGGATGLGGLIVDYATFDWSKSEKLGVLAKSFGNATFTVKLRKEIHRNLGAYMTPQVAYMQTLGLETLTLRYRQSTATCKTLAQKTAKLPGVESVNYTGLENNPYFEIGTKQFGENPGAMFTFDLTSREAAFSFLNKLKLVKRATNLFDNKTLAIHPASTIFGTFTQNQRDKMNISDKTIRISVGLEDADDIFQDFKQALM
jgi:O-acetylhomoserine (thiol)-lyase